jgi:feruloyl esterase
MATLLMFCGITRLAADPSAQHLNLEQLRQVRLPDVRLENVTAPPGSNYTQVIGVIGAAIRFELLLPDAWNGRFTMGGGGGFVGSIQNGARFSVQQGYATVGTDTGHESPGGISAAWAHDDLEAQVNFGHLAVHRTAEVAKALVRAYYGKDTAYSYFLGCSRGGGQAMMESQRYPQDFDGIVAGAPAFDWTGIAALAVTIAQKLYPDPAHLDQPVIDNAALVRLQKSILEQCDAKDGLKDGIVQDPPTAGFDLAKVDGLSEAQRQAFAVIFGEVRDGQGRLIAPGYTPGAECDPNQWTAWITGSLPPLVAQAHAPDLMFAFGTQIFKNLIFNQPDWDYSTYNFSHFRRDTELAASFLNATNENLDAFKARKGKLVLWHGWADTALPPQDTINYYRQLQKHDPQVAEYCRLFMVAGCLHCGGGPGASDVDWLSVISEWVEHGRAPDVVIAKKLEKGSTVMTRPIYPYPQSTVYKGSGDPHDAASFKAKTAQN